MLVPSLPREVMDLILNYLVLSDLYTVSLLSRNWHACAFSRLYKSVYLSRAAHLESFTKRIASDDSHGTISITACLKELIFDSKLEEGYEDKGITQLILDNLKAVIPRFNKLRRLCWDLPFIPRDTEIFHLFQISCPELESVNLSVKSIPWLPPRDVYPNLFRFSNLSEFSLTMTLLTYSSNQYLEPLAFLISSSPFLESFSLNVYRSGHPDFTYSPSSLLTVLGDEFTIPHLRTFHALGSIDPNWQNFLGDRKATHPLRKFFLRHPRIEDLAFGWIPDASDEDEIDWTTYRHPNDVDPEDVAQLFPSVKHLRGPLFLCKAIVRSTLASQLESLVVVDPIYDKTEGESAIWDFADEDTALPRLRCLAIWIESSYGIRAWPLYHLLKASDSFEDLEIRSNVVDYADFLILLRQLPNLRRLTLPESILDLAAEYHENQGEDENIDEGDEGEAEADGDEDEGNNEDNKEVTEDTDEDEDENKDEDEDEEKEEEDDVGTLDWEQFLSELVGICPHLKVVRKYLGDQRCEVWEVVRGVDGELRVVRVRGDR